MISALHNRRESRRWIWVKIWLEDRLLKLMLSGEVTVTDSRWKAYCAIIEAADERAQRYYMKYIQNT